MASPNSLGAEDPLTVEPVPVLDEDNPGLANDEDEIFTSDPYDYAPLAKAADVHVELIRV